MAGIAEDDEKGVNLPKLRPRNVASGVEFLRQVMQCKIQIVEIGGCQHLA